VCVFAAAGKRAETFDAKPVPPSLLSPLLTFLVENPKVVWNKISALQTELSFSQTTIIALTRIVRDPETTADVPTIPTSPAENAILLLPNHRPSASRTMRPCGIVFLPALLTLLGHSYFSFLSSSIPTGMAFLYTCQDL